MLRKRLYAVFTALAILAMSVVTILPMIAAEGDPEIRTAEVGKDLIFGTEETPADEKTASVPVANLFTEGEQVTSITANVTVPVEGGTIGSGRLAISAKEEAEITDNLITVDVTEGTTEGTAYTLTLNFQEEDLAKIDYAGNIQFEYWWSEMADPITVDSFSAVIGGEFYVPEVPEFITVLEGGTAIKHKITPNGSIRNQLCMADKEISISFNLADLEVAPTDTINKVEMLFSNSEFLASPRFNGRYSLTANDTWRGLGYADTSILDEKGNVPENVVLDSSLGSDIGQYDKDQEANPFTLTWTLTPEEAAGVDATGQLQINLYWTQNEKATFALQETIITVNGEYVQVPVEPKEPEDTTQYVDYATALQEALYLYDANMCGPYVNEYSAVNWRSDCHTEDIYDVEIDGVTYHIDLNGGYHDAGDHVKFGLPAAYTATVLGMSYYQFGEAFDQTKNTDHLKTITSYFAEYFKKCLIRDENGKVISFVYQVGDAKDLPDHVTDHKYWGPPEDQLYYDDPETEIVEGSQRDVWFTSATEGELVDEEGNPVLDEDGNPVIGITSANLAADIIGGTISALVMNYLNFGNEEDLQAAKDLYEYIHSYSELILNDTSIDTDNIEIVSKVPEYARWESGTDQNSPWDYISVAARLLSIVDEDETAYADFLDPKLISPKKAYYPLNWDGFWPLYHILSEQYNYAVNDFNVTSEYSKKLDLTDTNSFFAVGPWGSSRHNANLQFTGLIYDKLQETNTYTDWAVGQMNYIFGKNPEKQAFVVGYNFREDVKYPLYPHHRASDGATESVGSWDTVDPEWAKDPENQTQRPQAHNLVGALVGGPQTGDLDYYDALNNYVGNEVAIDYQAGFVGALAGLYLSKQNDDGATLKTTALEIDATGGLNDRYFGEAITDFPAYYGEVTEPENPFFIEPIKLGDVNCDDKVDTADIALLLQLWKMSATTNVEEYQQLIDNSTVASQYTTSKNAYQSIANADVVEDPTVTDTRLINVQDITAMLAFYFNDQPFPLGD